MLSSLGDCVSSFVLSGDAISHGPIAEVSATSATIWARGVSGGAFRVRCWAMGMKDAPCHTAFAIMKASDDFTARCTVSGLDPCTRYEYVVETKARYWKRIGTFRTAALPDQPAACSFVFGSCIGGQGYGRYAGKAEDPSSGFPAFGAMLDMVPDFFVCNGDIIYADNAIEPVATTPWNKDTEHVVGEGMAVANDLDGFRARYRYHLADPKLGAFYAATPLVNTWDDHEIFDDWGAEKLVSEGKAQLLEDGQRAWFEYHPHTGPPEEPRRIYRTVRWGAHVELFVLDCRSYRSRHELRTSLAESDAKEATPQMKTILGATQFDWLLDALGKSTATWKMICTSIPLSYPTGWPRPQETGYDGWADGVHGQHSTGPERELKAILEFIRSTPITNVVFISGDVHFPFCISYDPFGDGKPLVHEIGATPIHALCLPAPEKPGDQSLNPSVLYAGKTEFGGSLQNFGRCEINDAGEAIFSLHDIMGGELYKVTLTPSVKA